MNKGKPTPDPPQLHGVLLQNRLCLGDPEQVLGEPPLCLPSSALGVCTHIRVEI